MRISDKTLLKLLERNHIVAKEQQAPLIEEASHASRTLQEQVLETKLITERDLTKLFADYTELPFIEIEPRDIPAETLNKIPERIASLVQRIVKYFQIGRTHIGAAGEHKSQ